MLLAGATAAPYVKKVFNKVKSKEEIKEIEGSSSTDVAHETDTELAIEAIEADEERHKYRFLMTTGTMGVAVIAQATSLGWLMPITCLLIGYFSFNIFQEASNALFKEKKLKVDVLDTGVIVLTLFFGQIAAAAFMVWIIDLADMLLQKTTKKSRNYITDIFGEQPRFAWLLVDGVEVQVEVKDLKQNDIVMVGTGEQIDLNYNLMIFLYCIQGMLLE